ncbi:hypothetical protein H6P81_019613 [Aristolochia fimbriata]|uniref:Uncharacterized protein n=1 Tax=Aristolochia fimbriata TaxID=158543 RepID=A0AAV7DSB7_ARIFI|nr:hypothetical protein H6P81_019613 [Aristolochia fimbriata]
MHWVCNPLDPRIRSRPEHPGLVFLKAKSRGECAFITWFLKMQSGKGWGGSQKKRSVLDFI